MSYEVVQRCPLCQQFRPKRKLQVERLNVSTARLTWAIDHKCDMMLHGKPHFVFCAVEITYRLVSLTLCKSVSAQETAEIFFQNIICVYGGAVEIISDRSKSFLNDLFLNLLRLANTKIRVTSSYGQRANFAEERVVRKLSSALKAVCYSRDPKEWGDHLKYIQLCLNSSTVSPYLSQPPFALLMGSENSFFHPLLELQQSDLPFNKFWSNQIQKLQDINKVLIEKYDIFLAQKSNKRHTVTSLGLKVGDPVWMKIFQFSPRLKFMKHILPKYKLAKIEKILGQTTLILRNDDTGKLVSRNLQDCAPVKFTGNYGNLYTDSLTAQKTEIEEDFQGLEPSQIPYFDSIGLDREILEAKKQTEREPEDWNKRLRSRKKVNYKE